MNHKQSENLKGVFVSTLKDGTKSYRASIRYKTKHIALGSFTDEDTAHKAFLQASKIVSSATWNLTSYNKSYTLAFDKCVVLYNFKKSGMYIPNPIVLDNKFFSYYLSPEYILKFDIDDLFYYSSHRIIQRGSHLYVNDYGSQISVYSRYGIKSFAVEGRDYRFRNGDSTDLRYENIEILNRYHGVRQYADKGFMKYKAVIHVRSNYVVGKYNSEIEAAIAYNKAADIINAAGISKNYELNYIDDISAQQYAEIYTKAKISKSIYNIGK